MSSTTAAVGLASLLPGLVCGGGMALCMWMMGRGKRGAQDRGSSGSESDSSAEEQGSRIEALEAEVARLRGEQRQAQS